MHRCGGTIAATRLPERRPLSASEIAAALKFALALDGSKLSQTIDFFGMKMPAVQYMVFTLAHMVHHRGQLSTYLRPMGSRVPSIYGGSFDEQWTGPKDADS